MSRIPSANTNEFGIARSHPVANEAAHRLGSPNVSYPFFFITNSRSEFSYHEFIVRCPDRSSGIPDYQSDDEDL